ncbi:MAG: nucleotidyltransferase family protein [Methylotenera sp.]|nr:nucleotidyltransferase family protein [Methylotenera sp.]
MKAMILAAGRGERMRPLTDHTPKPLLKIGGKPLIVWHLERLAKAGFKEIVVNHAHLGGQIEAALGNGSQWGLSIRYSPEKVALETAGGITNALPLLGDEPFLVVNGDTFTEIDFSQLKLNTNNLAHLVLVDNPPQHPNGDFAIEVHEAKSNVVISSHIRTGPLKNHGSPMLTFSGVGVYHPDLFASIVQGEPAKLAPLLRLAISEGKATAEHYQGVWHDIGTPERLISLEKSLNI